MKREFVKTKNARLFDSKIASAQQRGANEGGLVIVMGRPGDGKTRTMEAWAATTGAIMVTGQVDSTPRKLLMEMAAQLKIDVVKGFELVMEEMIVKGDISIIVDEAGFCMDNKALCLEKLRGITDRTKTLLVLVFMERDRARLADAKVQQLQSRVYNYCNFQKNSLEDISLSCAQLGEVAMEPALVEHIYKKTDGSMRLAVNAIRRIELIAAARSPEKSQTPMTLADIQGAELTPDHGKTSRKTTA